MVSTGQRLSPGLDYLAAIVDSSHDAIVAKDLNGIITVWNERASALFGYSAEEIVGQSIKILIPPERVDEEAAILARIVKGESLSHLHTERLRKDGSRISVTINVSPIRDETRQIVGAVKTMRDIENSGTLTAHAWDVIEAAAVAMIVVDRAGKVALANAESERLFQYTRAELMGMAVEGLVPRPMRPAHTQLRAEFIASPRARQMGKGREVFALRKDGKEVPVEIGLTPTRNGEGEFTVASIIDISFRREAEAKLARHREELERSNKDLEQFAYVASHDLQEPLRAVAGCVRLLQKSYEGNLDARADQFIAHAVDGCKRMQQLIDDLLTFSRLGRGEKSSHGASCGAAFANALGNLSMAIAESRAEITADPLPSVNVDSTQLTMLFQNLLGNAIKFRKREESLKIHVRATLQGDKARISVTDNGIGIPAAAFERIFGIFQRLHTRREYSGTGIGLASCKRIVERHGGRIGVESTVGRGSTFFFTLPLASEVEK